MRVVGPWSIALDVGLSWLNIVNTPDNDAWIIERGRSVQVAEVLNVMAPSVHSNLGPLRLESSSICTHACTCKKAYHCHLDLGLVSVYRYSTHPALRDCHRACV